MNASVFGLKVVEAITDAALAKGRELRLAPLTVAVLDAGGILVMLIPFVRIFRIVAI